MCHGEACPRTAHVMARRVLPRHMSWRGVSSHDICHGEVYPRTTHVMARRVIPRHMSLRGVSSHDTCHGGVSSHDICHCEERSDEAISLEKAPAPSVHPYDRDCSAATLPTSNKASPSPCGRGLGGGVETQDPCIVARSFIQSRSAGAAGRKLAMTRGLASPRSNPRYRLSRRLPSTTKVQRVTTRRCSP